MKHRAYQPHGADPQAVVLLELLSDMYPLDVVLRQLL